MPDRPDLRSVPPRDCDVIMKGGITSGVVYPRALVRFAASYRLRRLGGASAGAIGAALGAAAEHGRGTGGFERLAEVPDQLGDGALARLFQPLPGLRGLFRVLLAATGHDAPGAASQGAARLLKTLGALLQGWPLAALVGALPGLAGLVAAFLVRGQPVVTVVVALLALALVAIGVVAGVLAGAYHTLSRDVPANGFGLCTGLRAEGGTGPGFTEWLSTTINVLAGRDPHAPLLYGHLWSGGDEPAAVPAGDRAVDLRMVTTCLSQGRPLEMPWDARVFFYEPAAWARLFPAEVMQALADAPVATPEDPGDAAEWRWEEAAAQGLARPLRRLPEPAHLPVVVSVRMSLSFPLLIAAIPLWTIDRRAAQTRAAVTAHRHGEAGPAPLFVPLWFTDGGFCSNFPVHLYDEALPTRPTFAINLGDFVKGREPSPSEADNIEFARNNSSGILPSFRPLPEEGMGALTGFFGAALATSREWSDASQLSTPGMRDRVVRVLQSGSEGGLNLFMDGTTITRLANRGEAAADALVDMFTQPHYAGQATGWDNHRWLRYRALMASLPAWLRAFAAGRAAMAGVNPAEPPSVPLSVGGRELADQLAGILATGADAVADDSSPAVSNLTGAPRPRTTLRRLPEL